MARKMKLPPEALALMREWGRAGGKKGGAARARKLSAAQRSAIARKASRARKLSPEERSAIARKAARARWKKKRT